MLAGTFVLALAIAAAVFLAGWRLLDAQHLKPVQSLPSDTLFDLVKLSFGVVAGAGALVALVVAYRRQRVDEDGALLEDTRQHTERFTAAGSQLGDSNAAVRLAGVHALAGLADDAPTRDLRQTCIDVLCAYLRLPYTAETDLPEGDAAARHGYLASRQVRHNVIRLTRDHLALPIDHPRSWQSHNLDLTSVVFDGGDFSFAVFTGGVIDFSGAVFTGGKVDFSGARFSGGVVDFHRAVFTGGTVDFHSARFSGGTVDFHSAAFSGGLVEFHSAELSGGLVDFHSAEFSGGTADFSEARGTAPSGLPSPPGPWVALAGSQALPHYVVRLRTLSSGTVLAKHPGGAWTAARAGPWSIAEVPSAGHASMSLRTCATC